LEGGFNDRLARDQNHVIAGPYAGVQVMQHGADAPLGAVALDRSTHPVTCHHPHPGAANLIRRDHQHDKRVGKRSSSPHPLDIGRSG